MTYDVGFYKHRVKVEHVNFVLDTQSFTFSFILLNDRIVFNAVSAKFHSGYGDFSFLRNTDDNKRIIIKS